MANSTTTIVPNGSKVKILKLTYGGANKFIGMEAIVNKFEPNASPPRYYVTMNNGESYEMDRSDFSVPGLRHQTKLSLKSVVMPAGHREAIEDVIRSVENYDLIFQEWGFEDTLEKGRAISMLFWGPPGTGKTLTAQAICQELGKELKVIGTAEIQSSNPGQAERNLKAYFEGSDSNTVLLFDECDSLIYDRNRTGSILGAQVNALLSYLENYEGIVIFTTNRLGVLDEAFNRRLSLKLEFALPTVKDRENIWKKMYPKKAPVAKDIPWGRLAQLELSGGYIKNIVLRSARAAANKKVPKAQKIIDYATIVEATKAEYKAMKDFERAKGLHHHIPSLAASGDSGMAMGTSHQLKQTVQSVERNSL